MRINFFFSSFTYFNIISSVISTTQMFTTSSSSLALFLLRMYNLGN